MQLRAIFLIPFAAATFAGVAATASPVKCMNGLRPALVAGGFSGSTDCKHDQLSIRYVGKVRSFGREYKIYENRYRLQPVCRECAIHGGQRIIIMEHGRYLGQYKSDFADVAIRDGRLVIVVPNSPGSKEATPVNFTAKGPPARHWDGSEVLLFFR